MFEFRLCPSACWLKCGRVPPARSGSSIRYTAAHGTGTQTVTCFCFGRLIVEHVRAKILNGATVAKRWFEKQSEVQLNTAVRIDQEGA